MHVFTIDHISETPVRVVESTYYYFAVVLPDASVPGHALVNITDPANINASLQSADGLNIWPPP